MNSMHSLASLVIAAKTLVAHVQRASPTEWVQDADDQPGIVSLSNGTFAITMAPFTSTLFLISTDGPDRHHERICSQEGIPLAVDDIMRLCATQHFF